MSKKEEIKIKCNPYLFLLLKRMVEFEVKNTLEIPVQLSEVREFIKSLPPLSELDPDNNRIEEHIRAFIWNRYSFYFVERYLDAMCRSISKLGRFKNWQDFIHQFGKRKFAQQAIQYMSEIGENDENKKVINPISDEKLKLILTWVERDLEVIRKRRSQEGWLGKPKHNLALDEMEYMEFDLNSLYKFRYPSMEEIHRIANLANRVYPCPINDFEVKKPWLEKNPKIFIICEDTYGELIANLNVLPLKEKSYKSLKSGEIYESEISANEIYSLKERKKVKYLYIEGFASLSVHAQHLYRTIFFQIINGLAEAENENLVICSIGGSAEGNTIMKRAGFEVTGNAVDHRTGLTYPFFEIKWKALNDNINNRILNSPFENKK